MNHNVSSKLQWLDQIRGCHGVVYDQRYVILMCHFCNCLDIGNVQLGVSDGLRKNNSRLLCDLCLKSFRLILFHIFYGNPERLQIIEQFHGSAVQSAGCHDLISRLKNVQKRIGQRCHSGCTGHTADSILQHGHSLLKGLYRRIVDPCIGEAHFFIVKNFLQVFRTVMSECAALIDRNLCGSLRIFLISAVEQSCIKAVFVHSLFPFFC